VLYCFLVITRRFRYEQLLLLQALVFLLAPPPPDVSNDATRPACDHNTLLTLATLFHAHRFSVSSSQLVFLPSSPSIRAMTRKLQHMCVLVLVNAMQLVRVMQPVDSDSGASSSHPVLMHADSKLQHLLTDTYVEEAQRWYRNRSEPPPYVRTT